jgi:hypothetical protein
MASQSAVQRALELPEILQIIFLDIEATYFIKLYTTSGPDNVQTPLWKATSPHKNLARCCLVNRIFYLEASRQLWKNLTYLGWHQQIPDLFKKVSLERRQQLAGYVTEGRLATVYRGAHARSIDDILDGLKFPRLRKINLSLKDGLDGAFLHIPQIDGSAVQTLHVEAKYNSWDDTHGMNSSEFGDILNQIPVSVLVSTCFLEFNAIISIYFQTLRSLLSASQLKQKRVPQNSWPHSYLV